MILIDKLFGLWAQINTDTVNTVIEVMSFVDRFPQATIAKSQALAY